MASATRLLFKINGVGGHGSRPEQCKNPVPVAAEVYLELNKILDVAMKEFPTMKASLPK